VEQAVDRGLEANEQGGGDQFGSWGSGSGVGTRERFFFTDDGLFTYHGLVTITTSSHIISRDMFIILNITWYKYMSCP
jgi:hypothetical protein